MINNSMCGIMGNLKSEMGSLKSEKSCTKPGPTSPDDKSWVSESKKSSSPQSTSAQLMKQKSLTPSSLSFPAIKFEAGGDDMEVKSPDSSLWESFFSDNLADGDFMISSPVRNVLPSPQASSSTCNHESMHGQSLLGCSPPRVSYQLGAANYSSSSSSIHNNNNKGKGMSPLNKVFSSPNNNNNNNHNEQQQQQHMQLSAESLSLLPALESLLDIDDYDEIRDDPECFIDHYQAVLLKNNNSAVHVGSSSSYTTFDTIPALLESWTLLPNTSSFSGSVSETSVPGTTSQLTRENHLYQMAAPSIATTAPLSQQLQQQPKKEKQQEEQTLNINQSFMMPLSVMSEQVQEQDSGLELVHLLLACAEAVAKEDYMLARRYLHHLNRVVTPLGNSMQRVASFFTEALSARLATTTPKPPFTPLPTNSLEVLKIYQILYQACPYIKFAHFTANQAIFEAFEEEERVHVIDLDINQGYQWPAFMQALAARPGGAPFLRITGVGSSLESVRETGWCLTELAQSLRIPFEFHPVGERLEDLKPHMFQRRVGEALAVNSVSRLHSVPAGNCLGNLLAMIRDQAPSIVTIVEQEASHNGPYFLGRFLEALHYYSAIFDSLDATFPPDSAQRAKVEHYIFAPEIRNVVACEGQERVVRHERLDKWRKLMEGKGFTGVPLSENAVTQSNILLSVYSCDGYSLKEDKGCLLLGWQDRPILAASAWRC